MDLGLGPAKECQWIGAEQVEWPYIFCGKTSLTGKSYCGEHYHKMYQKGSATAGRRKEKAIDKEIEELKRQQEIDEVENYND
jgi:hypothetical protein